MVTFFVTVTFDLKAASWQDYVNAYAALGQLGLSRDIVSDSGGVCRLPNTTCAGKFTGLDVATVRSEVANRVVSALRALWLQPEVFVSVGTDWAWAYRAAS